MLDLGLFDEGNLGLFPQARSLFTFTCDDPPLTIPFYYLFTTVFTTFILDLSTTVNLEV